MDLDDFLGLPFSVAKLLAIASAYERATGHRTPPPDFGPLDSRGRPSGRVSAGEPRPLPRARKFRADELRAIEQD